MEKEKSRDHSINQPEKGPKVPYPALVVAPAVWLIVSGVAESNEKEIIIGAGLLGIEVGVLLLEKRFKVKQR